MDGGRGGGCVGEVGGSLLWEMYCGEKRACVGAMQSWAFLFLEARTAFVGLALPTYAGENARLSCHSVGTGMSWRAWSLSGIRVESGARQMTSTTMMPLSIIPSPSRSSKNGMRMNMRVPLGWTGRLRVGGGIQEYIAQAGQCVCTALTTQQPRCPAHTGRQIHTHKHGGMDPSPPFVAAPGRVPPRGTLQLAAPRCSR